MTRRIVLKKLRIGNFKGYKEAEFDFYGSTRVTGHNGVGKSSIAAAYMWLFLNIDYNLANNPAIRRKIEGNPVNDVLVGVEATLDIDGTVVTAKKVQKRSFKKDGSYTDDNSYFINDVPKTLRDFNAYFDFDMKLFKLCTNINAFLGQEPGEMREFLFGLVPDITNLDVAQQFEELSDLVPLLEKYTVEKLTAMNKASIKKIKAQQDGIPAAIAENRRYLVDDVDTAEMELQKNALEEQLQDVRKQRDDSREAYKAVVDLQAEIMKTKLDIGGMEQAAAMRLEKQRRDARQLHGDLQAQAYDLMQTRQGKESELERQQAIKEKKQVELDGLVEEWKKARTLTMDESETVCKFCGQELPTDKLEEVRAKFQEKKAELITYGQYYDHEKFCIALQSKFKNDENRALLLKFAGTVEAGTVAGYGDDGVSQKATVKTGIASKGDAIVPSPIKLRPYRTFHEVEQPASEFIFRMKQDKEGGVSCALFEADGGAWRNAAMENVKKYLEFELASLPQFTVIS